MIGRRIAEGSLAFLMLLAATCCAPLGKGRARAQVADKSTNSGSFDKGAQHETLEPPPLVLQNPKVVDTGRLQAGRSFVELYGIEGIAGDLTEGLAQYIKAHGRQVTCQAKSDASFVCLLPDGTDVAEVVLVNGAGRAKPDAPEAYRKQEASSQAARRGIWASLPPPPARLKHPTILDTATLLSDRKTYVLYGIVGLGPPFSSQLQDYLAGHGDNVTCQQADSAGHFICLLDDGTDLAAVVLVNGAARVGIDAPDSYRIQQQEALRNRRGYWASAPDATVAAARKTVAAQEPSQQLTDAGSGDGINNVGGQPAARIDGQTAIFVYAGYNLGWGYYDSHQRWHDARDRFAQRLEKFRDGATAHTDEHLKPTPAPSPPITTTPEDVVPYFPWPPPTPSAQLGLSSRLFRDPSSEPTTFARVADQMTTALKVADYREYTFYQVPGGFALVARLERIRPDGSPYPPEARYLPMDDDGPDSFSSYIRSLFFAQEGFYRVIVFLVTDRPFVAHPKGLDATEAQHLLSNGANELSPAILSEKYLPRHSVTALIYEYRKGGRDQEARAIPSPLPAASHLRRAGLVEFLK